MVSTWRKVSSSVHSRNYVATQRECHKSIQGSSSQAAGSARAWCSRENSSGECEQVNNLLSPVAELGNEGERLRSIRDSHHQAEKGDLRN